MAKKVSTYSGLQAALMAKLADAMDEAAGRSKELVQKHVETDVYTAGSDRKSYYNDTQKPTYGLHDSVVHSKPTVSGNTVKSVVSHDENLMDCDPDTYLHGSTFWDLQDVRALLPKFIDEGLTGHAFGPRWNRLKRPYFSNAREELRNGKFREYLVDALRKRGVDAGAVTTKVK